MTAYDDNAEKAHQLGYKFAACLCCGKHDSATCASCGTQEGPSPRQWQRGDRVYWMATGMHARFGATILRVGRVYATLVCTAGRGEHWYTQRAKLGDLTARGESLPADRLADEALQALP